MAWTYDRVGEAVFWGSVSGGAVAVLLAVGCACGGWLLFACWLLSSAALMALSRRKVRAAGRAVVVTGCDTGIGHALALHLHALGFRVFAGCLNAGGEGAGRLRGQGSSSLVVLQMDVTSEEQLDKAAHQVKQLLPKGEVLWGLVNNAGVSASGHLEWVPVNTYRRVTEVNVLGVIAATKTFLPLIRHAQGRVVNMSSVAGVMGTALLSAYTLTKHAVEGLSDCLRQEMKPWGVSVSVVEPSNFNAATEMVTAAGVRRQWAAMWAGMDDALRADYGQQFHAVQRVMQAAAGSGESDLTPVLAAITEALTQRSPRARYRVVNTYYYFKVAAAIHLSEWLFDLLYQPRQVPRVPATTTTTPHPPASPLNK